MYEFGYSLGKILANIIFCCCVGLAIGFAIVFWKTLLLVGFGVVALFILFVHYKEFNSEE